MESSLTEGLNDKMLERVILISSPWVFTTWGQTCEPLCQGTQTSTSKLWPPVLESMTQIWLMMTTETLHCG